MAALTLATAQAHYDAWLAAELALAGGAQSYTITLPNGESRSLTRVDADLVGKRLTFWETKVNKLTPSTRQRTRYVVIGR